MPASGATANGKRRRRRAGPPLGLYKPKARSRITNGFDLLPGVDNRTLWVRRFRDLNALFATDLGGDPASLSEGQRCLMRRASALCIELEAMEVAFATANGATGEQLETFQRATNTLRRVLECLGITKGKIPRDVTPSLDEYLRSRQRTIDNTGAQDG